ncbi:MAG: hypothetical protein SWH54_17540 [Thermodesulfobacteriota bacterium]|nr:hypothetical protein [Thermodesulfobacteriota bacterium]
MNAMKINELGIKLIEEFKYYKKSLERSQVVKWPKRVEFNSDIVIRRRKGEQDKRIPCQSCKS